jgi:hypothetical protein
MKRASAAIAATVMLWLPGLEAEAGSKSKPQQKAAAGYESGEQKVLEQILDEGAFTDLGDDEDGDALSDLDLPGEGKARSRVDRMKLEMPLDGAAEPAVAGKPAGARAQPQGRKALEIQLGADDQNFLEARAKRMQNAAAVAKKSKTAPAAAQVAATPGKVAPSGGLTSNAPTMATVDSPVADGLDVPKASRQRAAVAPQTAQTGQTSQAALPLEADTATATSMPLAAAQKAARAAAPRAARGKAKQDAAPSAAELPETLFDTATAAAPGGKARRAPKAATADELDDPMPTQDPDTTADALAGMLSDAPSGGPDDDDELLAEAAAASAKNRPAPKAATADRYASATRKAGKISRDATAATVGKTSAAGRAGKSEQARSKGRSKQKPAAADALASASTPREAGRAGGSKLLGRPAGVAAASGTTAVARSDAGKDLETGPERQKRAATAVAATESATPPNAPAKVVALAEDATQPLTAAKRLGEVGNPDALTARGGMSPGLIATLVGLALLVATGAGTAVWRSASERATASDDQDEVKSPA